MEAAMEQACSQAALSNPAPVQTAITGLSLQQSRQVLGALEEAFSAEIYYLKQVRMQVLNMHHCIMVQKFVIGKNVCEESFVLTGAAFIWSKIE